MSGSNTMNQAGVYGTKGMPDADNVPGARERQHFLDRQRQAICGCSGATATAAPLPMAALTTCGAMILRPISGRG